MRIVRALGLIAATAAFRRPTPRLFHSLTAMSATGASGDEATIRSLVGEFAGGGAVAFVEKHATDDWQFIRPSGNPLTKEEYGPFLSGDVQVTAAALVEVHKIDVGSDMAMASITQSASFTYKGTPNDDVFVVSLVMKKVEGKWFVSWCHRSTGRKPDEDKPVFVFA